MSKAEIRLPDLIVTSELVGEESQPWSGATCYGYRVRVSGRGETEGFVQMAYGSQHDYEQGDDGAAEELAWMTLWDLLSAYDDPEEFFSLAIGEDNVRSIAQVRSVLGIIDYAASIGAALELNRSTIEEHDE